MKIGGRFHFADAALRQWQCLAPGEHFQHRMHPLRQGGEVVAPSSTRAKALSASPLQTASTAAMAWPAAALAGPCDPQSVSAT